MPHPPSILHAAGTALISLWLIGMTRAAPTGTNLGFESGLTGWTSSNVAIVSTKVHAGTKSLALKNGFIQQTFTGLTPGQLHTVKLAYRDDTSQSWILSDARIRIDGTVIGEIHNGQRHDYLDAGGFEFTATGSTATLRIESLDPGPEGFLLDEIRIVNGGLPAPPEHAWSSLIAINDTRGGRRLANGSFEDAPLNPETVPDNNPATDPDNSGPTGNPHLAGLALPGWRVTRENVDLIEGSTAKPPHGSKVVDLNGHGPGGIAQTITGLQPGAVYTLSFRYARHTSWGTADMTGEAFANRRRVASLVRNIAQTWNQSYDLKEIPVLAAADGKLTIELRSTTTDQGGNIVYDDVRLKSGGDGLLAWSTFHGVTSGLEADDDRDTLANGLEFVFGSDPKSSTMPPLLQGGTLRVPISGLARSQGYDHKLRTSRNLAAWQDAGTPGSGMTLLSDTSAPGTHGERLFRPAAGEPRLFWRHLLIAP
jgi:hypothetical protein